MLRLRYSSKKPLKSHSCLGKYFKEEVTNKKSKTLRLRHLFISASIYITKYEISLQQSAQRRNAQRRVEAQGATNQPVAGLTELAKAWHRQWKSFYATVTVIHEQDGSRPSS